MKRYDDDNPPPWEEMVADARKETRAEIAIRVLIAFAGDPSTANSSAEKLGRVAVAYADVVLAELDKPVGA